MCEGWLKTKRKRRKIMNGGKGGKKERKRDIESKCMDGKDGKYKKLRNK